MGQPRVYLFQSGMGSDKGALAKRVCLALSQVLKKFLDLHGILVSSSW